MYMFVLFVLWLLSWILEVTLIVCIVNMQSTLGIVALVICVLSLRFAYTVFDRTIVWIHEHEEELK